VTAVDPLGYPADLGVGAGRIVVDNGAPPSDGTRYTLKEAAKAPAAATLAAVYPTSIVKNGPDVLLRALGTGFHQGDRIVIGTSVERTTYMSSDELSTWITGSLFTNPDPAVAVKVRTQAGDTAVKTFAVV
jgi:hypothetical protein